MLLRTVATSGLLALTLGVVAPSAHAQECGDVDLNGHVSASDALLVLKKAVGAAVQPLFCALPATGQTTSYGTGDDGDVQAGASRQYRDNADGTITDLHTGLMWEKKIGRTGTKTPCSDTTGSCANPHEADNTYTWAASGTAFDGTAVTIFLEQLNNRCSNDPTIACNSNADCAGDAGPCGFAGHRDWRLPNFLELLTLQHLENVDPRADALFEGAQCGAACTDIADAACSCTFVGYYASSSTIANQPSLIWLGNFGTGGSFVKTDFNSVRAVRGL